MNRIIKFRVPHFDPYGVFVYFSYWGTIDYKGEPSLDHGCFVSPSSGMKKGWHEQFTGLTDKNGTDIYEGDIIDDIPPFVVRYGIQNVDAFEGVGFNLWGFYGHYEDIGNAILLQSELEVIGNVHQHPELI